MVVATKAEATSDKNQPQYQQEKTYRANSPPIFPLPGRKRAFSDPGDVNRPSITRTDRKSEAIASEKSQDSDMSMHIAAAAKEDLRQRSPPPLSATYIAAQADVSAKVAYSTYLSSEPPNLHEGFDHESPPEVSCQSRCALRRGSYHL